ncbi:MAG: HIT domain-containing protein [Armatimonadota bacterium]|nr:HIT domain-containing protein [Armatimonadota bacterium]MDR7422588.1 HIT domain-containing protein [Armatimonadota bacterium]MDR7453591.1 HIT domain-containing protein [Armatimonadota bacterium]MDR7456929.1 HIT domain-containing protein [Armatimonadota bacterium]MDR7496765.1 HIT domain-containing protein [Armatimonadota bacterium]
MKHLWAPWRAAYVGGPKPGGCVFCDAVAAGDDRAMLIVHRGAHGYLILNRFPYNSGHLMAVPYRHVARPQELSAEEHQALMALVVLALGALDRAMAPEGFNVGMNLGRAAGAGIDEHLHMHVVPRWVGDTNYMPVLGEVKVLPQHLDETYARLVEALAAEVPGRD